MRIRSEIPILYVVQAPSEIKKKNPNQQLDMTQTVLSY